MSHMPSLFLSHGSPMLALENAPTTRFLRGLSAQLPRPRAILAASAHWETSIPMLTGSHAPDTIHDFFGFPETLYALTYPAPGDPSLATEIQSLLVEAGFQTGIEPKRGLDHGVWNPLLLMYPDADIPVIELSIQSQHDARWHYRLGQALASLKERDILVIGTGNLTHNLHEAFKGHHDQIPEWVTAFATWVKDRLIANDVESLLEWEHLAPYAHKNHPTPDHFLPFFVAMGAGETPLHARQLHEDTAMGVLAMDAWAF